MNITEAAIEAASLALHYDACTDDEHDACDRSDWAREAKVALEAALPHLQPTIPNTVDALGVEVAMPERDGRYQGDDGEWAVRHRKTRIIRAMRDRGDAENEARLNPDVEVVRRTVTAWRAP